MDVSRYSIAQTPDDRLPSGLIHGYSTTQKPTMDIDFDSSQNPTMNVSRYGAAQNSTMDVSRYDTAQNPTMDVSR